MTKEPERTPTEPEGESFLKATEKQNNGLIREFFEFMGENTKWWLLPFLIVFLLIGVLLVFGASAIAPFIYPFL